MSIAIDAIKLVLFLLGAFLYFIGNGWIIIFWVLKNGKINRVWDLSRIIPLTLISGFIINLGISLAIQSLSVSLVVGGLSATAGFVHLLYSLFYNCDDCQIIFSSANWWISVSFVGLVFLARIISSPISGWDARSIWFFHAKMMYTAKTMGFSAGWQGLDVLSFHPDYPKLLSLLAAQIAYIVGFWNEYLPKLALFFILTPALLLLFAGAKWRFSFFIFLLLVPFSFNRVMWNGYMDGLLALYVALAVLLLGRYMLTSSFWDLLSGLLSITLLPYLKNEGILASLVIFTLAGGLLYLQKRPSLPKFFTLGYWRYFIPFLILLLPMVIWEIYKAKWGLANDLQIGTSSSFAIFIERLTDGSYRFIVENLYAQLETSLLLIGLLLSALVVWKIKLPKSAYLPLSVAVFYSLGIAAVYFLTPHDLYWHVKTSVERTMLAVNASCFVGAYFILNAIESEYLRLKNY